MNQLELEKAKALYSVFAVRFNPNHDSDGKFASSAGGSVGGSGGGNDAKIKALEDELAHTSRFGSGAAKRKELQKQIDELKGTADNSNDEPKVNPSASGVASESQVVEPVSGKKRNPVTKEKEEQFAVIQKTNPMTDDYHTGIREPADIKSAVEAFKTDVDDGEDFLYPDFTPADAQKALDTGKITVYSSKPIANGGFISPSRLMAQDYAGGGKVYSQVVGINDVAWIDSNEGQLAKVNDEERVMPMNIKLEQRSYAFDLTAEEGVITGRPIVYDSRTNLGIFDEIIDKGALTGADLKDVRFLVNHDTSRIPLARSRNNNANSTMQLIPDDAGMKIRVKLDIQNNTEARNLYSAIQRGDISGMSFMFSVGDEAWDGLETDHPLRHVRSISNVVEVSAVTFPAYDATSISIRDKQALDSAKSALESARRTHLEALESEARCELELAKAKANFYLN